MFRARPVFGTLNTLPYVRCIGLCKGWYFILYIVLKMMKVSLHFYYISRSTSAHWIKILLSQSNVFSFCYQFTQIRGRSSYLFNGLVGTYQAQLLVVLLHPEFYKCII